MENVKGFLTRPSNTRNRRQFQLSCSPIVFADLASPVLEIFRTAKLFCQRLHKVISPKEQIAHCASRVSRTCNCKLQNLVHCDVGKPVPNLLLLFFPNSINNHYAGVNFVGNQLFMGKWYAYVKLSNGNCPKKQRNKLNHLSSVEAYGCSQLVE